MTRQKININDLTAGYKFPEIHFTMDTSRIAKYIDITESTDCIWRQENIVPPMAIVAFAMAELSNGISFPDGAIHISQELSFTCQIKNDDIVTCKIEVGRVLKRSNMKLLTLNLALSNQNNVIAISGQTEFMLPPNII